METTIKCKYCGKEIEITQAIKHDIEEKAKSSIEAELAKKYEDRLNKASEEKEKKLKAEVEVLLKDRANENDELKNRNKELTTQLLELNKSLRGLKEDTERRELKFQKELLDQRDKVREEIMSAEKDKSDLEIAELRKKLTDTEKALDDAQRKAKHGSQQLQGEVLELDLENSLKVNFQNDDIQPVAKGIKGADVKQIVKSPSGKTVCGTILWELKRTKAWTQGWVTKLKEDVRKEGADVAVIVSTALPEDARNGIGNVDGVWVAGNAQAITLATLLRDTLIKVTYQKTASAHQGRKADLIYDFVTSRQFVQQIEAIVESYSEMNSQIAKERVAYERLWKAREAQLQRIVLSAASVYGSMQGLVGGNALPQLKGLDLPLLELIDDNEALNLK